MRQFLVVILALLAPSLRAQDVIFNQHYKAGQRYHQTMTTQQEMNMDIGGQKMDRQVSTTMGMLATATAHENQRSKRVAIKYDSIKASISGNGQKFSFDSKEPDVANAGPLAAYAKITGQELRVVMDETEKVTDVENLDDTLRSLSGSEPASAQIYQQLFNKAAVKHMMEQSALRSPPGKPVKPGGSWAFSQELALPGIGRLVIRGFYTFKGMVDREGIQCAEVRAAADITIDTGKDAGADDESALRLRQMQLQVEEGKMEGVLYYDPAIDFTRQVQVTHKITLTGKIPDGSGQPLKLPMKQTITMVLDSLDAVK